MKLLILLLFSLPASATDWEGLSAVVNGALGGAESGQRIGVLVTQAPAKGPYGQVGLACTYRVGDVMLTVFEPGWCPLRMEF